MCQDGPERLAPRIPGSVKYTTLTTTKKQTNKQKTLLREKVVFEGRGDIQVLCGNFLFLFLLFFILNFETVAQAGLEITI